MTATLRDRRDRPAPASGPISSSPARVADQVRLPGDRRVPGHRRRGRPPPTTRFTTTQAAAMPRTGELVKGARPAVGARSAASAAPIRPDDRARRARPAAIELPGCSSGEAEARDHPAHQDRRRRRPRRPRTSARTAAPPARRTPGRRRRSATTCVQPPWTNSAVTRPGPTPRLESRRREAEAAGCSRRRRARGAAARSSSTKPRRDQQRRPGRAEAPARRGRLPLDDAVALVQIDVGPPAPAGVRSAAIYGPTARVDLTGAVAAPAGSLRGSRITRVFPVGQFTMPSADVHGSARCRRSRPAMVSARAPRVAGPSRQRARLDPCSDAQPRLCACASGRRSPARAAPRPWQRRLQPVQPGLRRNDQLNHGVDVGTRDANGNQVIINGCIRMRRAAASSHAPLGAATLRPASAAAATAPPSATT